MIKIGLIEDDKLLNESLSILLSKEGYKIYRGYSLADGIKLLEEELDLLILDLMLPDGLSFSLAERSSGIPIIFLTARDKETDMLRAYSGGCEDYIVKPFSPEILKYRVQVVLRRNGIKSDSLRFQGLMIEYNKRKVSIRQKQISLTAKEYQLLEYLSRNKGQVLSKEMILQRIWDLDGNFVEENTVSVTINRLRKKLGKKPDGSEYIKNVFGMGYVFGE